MSGTVHVRAPCRLHFGMFSFGDVERPQFGGAGLMIDPPAVEVSIKPAASFAARGAHQGRVENFMDSLVRKWTLDSRPSCEVAVDAPRDHIGLGVGTQLGLSLAAGVRRFLDLPPLEAPDLALAVGRGARSFVGTIGFQFGGLIVEYSKQPGEFLAAFLREELPHEWRFVLVCPQERQGLAGETEADAFGRLPPIPQSTTSKLVRMANDEVAGAVAWKDCAAFGEALYRFGRLAGECFAPVQGGSFASPEIESLVERIRSWGIPGVGQSSWGPTVFAVVANDDEAETLAARLHSESATAGCEITIARPSNTGAVIEVV